MDLRYRVVRTSPPVCDIALNALADHDGIDLQSPDFSLYDHVDPDALDELFTHRPDTIDSVVLEIDGATLEIWENNGLYAHVLENEDEDKEE